MTLEQLAMQIQKKFNFDSYTPNTNINSQQIKDLYIKPKNYKTSTGKNKENLCDSELNKLRSNTKSKYEAKKNNT